jgi:glycosyltransferase involved in cell wall biosynthesis
VSLRRFIDAHRVSKCTKEYDLFINQEHMTFIPSSARGSILICEVPPVRPSLIENLFEGLLFDPRIRTYDTIVVNSCYTKKWAEKYYGKEATVLYPPIDTQSFVSSMKENIILSVGRFFAGGHCKKQLEMINAFKQLCTEQELTDWEYYLVGGLGDNPEGHKYLEECKKEAKGYPVLFHINAPFEVVRELYGRAKIFWHATGLGEDENQHPERMEHFGITTAEAMAAGCVPVVINKGGQTEIVRHGVDGFLWNTVQELKECTVRLINDNALREEMGGQSIARSQDFSMEKFEQRVREIFLEM